MTVEVDELVARYGEGRRKLIESSLRWLDSPKGRAFTAGGNFNRAVFVAELMSRTTKKPPDPLL